MKACVPAVLAVPTRTIDSDLDRITRCADGPELHSAEHLACQRGLAVVAELIHIEVRLHARFLRDSDWAPPVSA